MSVFTVNTDSTATTTTTATAKVYTNPIRQQLNDAPHAANPHFHNWVKALKQDNKPWMAPYYGSFYRVKGPLQVKHVGSKMNLQLVPFVTRLNQAATYQLGSPLSCTVTIKRLKPIIDRHDQQKRYAITAVITKIDEGEFAAYTINALRDAPTREVACYNPAAGDQAEMIYTSGDPNLEFQGIIHSWNNKGFRFACYNPPEDHFGNCIEREDHCQIGFAVQDLPKSHEFNSSGDFSFCCRVIPTLFDRNGTNIRYFDDLIPHHNLKWYSDDENAGFYLNLEYVYHRPTSKQDPGVVIGRITGCAKNRLLAKTKHVSPLRLDSHRDIIPANLNQDLGSYFVRDGLVQILEYDTKTGFGHIQSVISRTTPNKGLFPYARRDYTIVNTEVSIFKIHN